MVAELDKSQVVEDLAGIDGVGLSDEEIASHVRLLFPTGGETTHGSLGNALHALLTHEGEWARLVAEPARAEAVVEEALRYESSIAVLPRMSASRAVAFRGVELPPDSWVLFAIAGASHDPAVHADPHRFDPDRPATDRLTFGRGVKSCPGMHLAKRNMVVALQALAARFPRLRLLEPVASQPRRTVLRCPDRLVVRTD